MDNMARNLLDEYRENRWETEPSGMKKSGGFWVTVSAIVILLAGFVFCANNKLLYADQLVEKIKDLKIGSVSVSQIYDSVVGESAPETEITENETPLG